jgi:beta-lactamase regulating signal transducer with metallopeptidase domain
MTAVVAWLWQGLAVAWLTGLVLHRMPRLNASSRHAIWWFALVAVLALPLFGGVAIMTAETSFVPGAGLPQAPGGAFAVPTIPGWLIACGVGIWLGAVINGLARIALGLQWLVRLEEQSSPLPESREVRLTMWSSVRGSGRRPELRVSHRARGACALGLVRPVIVVSRDLMDALGDEELDQIVMHEHAHLARYDDWSRLVQAVIASVAGLHPAVRFILREIDLEREAACDDRVVSRTGDPRRYASCLADAAGVSAMTAAYEPEIVPAAIRPARALQVRVSRLLEARRDRGRRLARPVTLASAITLGVAVIASQSVPPVIVFVEGSEPLPPVATVTTPLPAARVQRLELASDAVPVVASVGTHLRVRPRRRPDAQHDAETIPSESTIAADAQQPAATDPLASGSSTPLGTSRLAEAFHPPNVPPAVRVPTDDREGWIKVADAGTAVAVGAKRAGIATGTGARSAGTSIGSFFGRVGRAVASSF